MRTYLQEVLYGVFILIVLAAGLLYWRTSPTYGIKGTCAPKTAQEKVQYYGPLFLLAVAALLVFFAALDVPSNGPHHSSHHHTMPVVTGTIANPAVMMMA